MRVTVSPHAAMYLEILRDELYEGSWASMYEDLVDRLKSHGYTYKWPMPEGVGIEETLEFLSKRYGEETEEVKREEGGQGNG